MVERVSTLAPCDRRECEIFPDLIEQVVSVREAGIVEIDGRDMRVDSVKVVCSGESRSVQAKICHGVVQVTLVGRKKTPIVL